MDHLDPQLSSSLAPQIPKRSPKRAPSPNPSTKSTKDEESPPSLHVALPADLKRATSDGSSSDGSTYSQLDTASPRANASRALPTPVNTTSVNPVSNSIAVQDTSPSPTDSYTRREKSSSGSSHNRKTSVVSLDHETTLLRSPREEGFQDQAFQTAEFRDDRQEGSARLSLNTTNPPRSGGSSAYSTSSRQDRSRTSSQHSMPSSYAYVDNQPVTLGEKPYFPIPSRQSSALFPEANYEYTIPSSTPPTPPPRMSSQPGSPNYPRGASPIYARESSLPDSARRLLHKTSSSSLVPRSPKLRSPTRGEHTRSAPNSPLVTPPLFQPTKPTSLKKSRSRNLLFPSEEDLALAAQAEPFDVPLQALHGLGYSDSDSTPARSTEAEPLTTSEQPWQNEASYTAVLANYVSSSPNDSAGFPPDRPSDRGLALEEDRDQIQEEQRASHIRSPAVDATPIATQEAFRPGHASTDSTATQRDAKRSMNEPLEGGNTEELDILSEIQAAIDETTERREERQWSRDAEQMEETIDFDTSFGTIVAPSSENHANQSSEDLDQSTELSPMSKQGYFDTAPGQPDGSPRRRQSAHIARARSTGSITRLTDITNHQPSRVQLQRLTRIRPLPPSADFRDIKQMRTSLERATAYAKKINALAKEDSGLETWLSTKAKPKPVIANSNTSNISRTISQRRASQPAILSSSSASTSSRIRRSSSYYHSRYEPSTVEFPVRQDSGRATDITQNNIPAPSSFVPHNLPFPGALPQTISKASPIPSPAPPNPFWLGGQSSQAPVALPKQTMNPLMSLGRRMSKKSAGPRTISAPLQAGPRPTMHGPRDLDSPDRQSFSRASISGHSMGGNAEFSEEVEQLAAVLPNATKEALERYLAINSGDFSAAVSHYLEDERRGVL